VLEMIQALEEEIRMASNMIELEASGLRSVWTTLGQVIGLCVRPCGRQRLRRQRKQQRFLYQEGSESTWRRADEAQRGQYYDSHGILFDASSAVAQLTTNSATKAPCTSRWRKAPRADPLSFTISHAQWRACNDGDRGDEAPASGVSLRTTS
jgi:hypothetical protein